jgi:hypothetical protein
MRRGRKPAILLPVATKTSSALQKRGQRGTVDNYVRLLGKGANTTKIMAEFDSNRFSAVSAFFGMGTQEETTTSSSASHVTRGREGVGSNAVKKIKPMETVGRILKVGKRKQLEEEEDDHYEERLDHENVDEEVEGRTAIAEKSAPKLTAPPIAAKQLNKKKKTGKKERQAENSELPQNEGPIEGTVEKDISQAEATKAKRKKPKIRSRQKNIYKDTRLAQHKPSHLIRGRPEFHGRPLTAETRARLNLPPSRSSRQHKNSEEDRPTETTSPEGSGMKLAIDDLLDIDKQDSEEIAMAVDEPKKTKQKRKKKSKYKNLA